MTTRIANLLTRNLAAMFQGSFTNQRHNFAVDYGWPEEVTFQLLWRAAHRNGIARAAVDKTALRVWQHTPEIWESEEPKESTLESDVRQHFEDIRFWQSAIEADRRAYIAGYSGLILRFGDNKRFGEAVENVPGGIKGLVGVEPVWASQLVVKDWNMKESDPGFGRPLMFELRERGLVEEKTAINAPPRRNYDVHPDRVIIWSRDGTVYSRSDLEAGYNDLLDMEKIKGAGGEGFWKTAKGLPVIEVDPEARIADMAEMMGVAVDKVKAAIDEEVSEFQLGFNKSLMLAGMKATAVNVVLPQPKEFFQSPLQSFAASVCMPVRILLRNETGERASTQDQEDFDRACMARREKFIVPTLREFLRRLEKASIIPVKDYTVGWESLLDMSPDQKMARSKQMADINKTAADPMTGSHPIFTEDEIREEAGFVPLTAAEKAEFDEAAEEIAAAEAAAKAEAEAKLGGEGKKDAE